MRAAVLQASWCILVVLLAASGVGADEADTFFDDSRVHEIRLYFDDSQWLDTLVLSHTRDPEDPYFPARFVAEGVELDPVGVRCKGNSSFRITTAKKSFKIDFNEYDEGIEGAEDTTFFGLTKLNLNNSFKDPTMLREKLFLDFAARYLPTIRAVHVRLYVNDVYWGLYTAVEQLDKRFIHSRFGDDEDGNLYEGEPTSGGVFGSDLSYLGPDPEPYAGYYQLKTNEEENDYSGLVELIDILNNTPVEQLPERLEPVLDVQQVLAGLALNLLFVNLDSYCGSAHNYYLYDRDDTGRFTHLLWDSNEAFGSFRMGVAADQGILTLPPFWLPTAAGMGSGPAREMTTDRPLMENLWAVDAYARQYLRLLARMLREGFSRAEMQARITELADLIRDDVYADPNKPYGNAVFERNLELHLVNDRETLYGLLAFVTARSDWLGQELDSYAEISDLRLNEVMPLNLGTVQDQDGDYDPWLEITNLGPGRVGIQDCYLSDDPSDPGKWAIKDGSLADGAFLVIWIDGDTGEGADHAGFRLDANGGELVLSQLSGTSFTTIDSVSYPAMQADHSYQRPSELVQSWAVSDRPSFAATNQPAGAGGSLVINELMADNQSTIADPQEAGAFDDWIEIFNPGGEAIDMSGMYLTDDLDDPLKWQVPEGTVIAAGGYLLVWADSDEEQGALHAGFKLSADGEEVGLRSSDGVTEIDTVEFGPQLSDVSYGRLPDGTGPLVSMMAPTPGAANSDSNAMPRRTGGRR